MTPEAIVRTRELRRALLDARVRFDAADRRRREAPASVAVRPGVLRRRPATG